MLQFSSTYRKTTKKKKEKKRETVTGGGYMRNYRKLFSQRKVERESNNRNVNSGARFRIPEEKRSRVH